MRRALKGLMHLSLTLIVLGAIGFVYAGSLVARAIEAGGTRALGSETRVGDVDLRVLRGSLGLSDLSIANPEGFSDASFLELGELHAEVAPRSLLSDRVVIPRLSLDGVEVSLEGAVGRTNYGTLLRNARGDTGPESGEPAKRYVIEELVISDVNASVGLTGLGASLASTEVQIPELRLRDLGSGGGLTLAELIARVTRAVVDGVARSKPQLRSALASDLRQEAEGLRGTVDQLREQAESTLDGLRDLFGRDED